MKKICLLGFFLWSFVAYAQEFKPVGVFSKDTLKVGEPVQFTLTFRHKSNLEVFFPDSAYNFMPFEYEKHDFFPTKTQDGISLDSAVYTLSSFDTDSVLDFIVPVFVVEKNDTTVYFTESQRVNISRMVNQLPDSVQLLANTEYRYVKKQINYVYIGLIVGGVLVVVFGLLAIFGGQIRRAYRLRRMKRQWDRFRNEFSRLAQASVNVVTTEKSLLLWKSYLESLQDIPFTSYTTKEIEQSINNEELSLSLKNIDRAIYGNIFDEQLRLAMQFLSNYAQSSYEEKVKEVRNV